jgi:prepilin-type processing-associated H-X9-DG protein
MEAEPTPIPAAEKPRVAFQRGEALYARFDLGKGWEDDPNREAALGAPAWFVSPAGSRATPGNPGLTQYVGIGGFGADAPGLARTDPRAGFFGYDRVIDRDDVQRGTSQTMIVTERADALGPWTAGGPATIAGVDPRITPYVPLQFGGLHPHGAHVLFADSHVVFLSDGANPRVWEEQSRINVE